MDLMVVELGIGIETIWWRNEGYHILDLEYLLTFARSSLVFGKYLLGYSVSGCFGTWTSETERDSHLRYYFGQQLSCETQLNLQTITSMIP